MYCERPELLAPNPLWIGQNQRTCVINLHQDSKAIMLSTFFQGELDNGLPNLSGKIDCPNKKKKCILINCIRKDLSRINQVYC